jgi:hypothetical protein
MKRRRKGLIYKAVRFFIASLALVSAAWIAGCDTAGTEATPAESFSRIYDQNNKKHFHALDIKQIPDEGEGGYIVLGMEDQHPYLLKLDHEGEVLNETKQDDFTTLAKEEGFVDFIEPVREVLVFADGYYIFCTMVAEKESALAGVSGKCGESRKGALLKLSEPNSESVPEPRFDVEYIEFKHIYDKYVNNKFYYKPIGAVKIPGSMNRETQQSESDTILYMYMVTAAYINGDERYNDGLQIQKIKKTGESGDFELFAMFVEKCTREYPTGFYVHSYIIPYFYLFDEIDYDYPTCFCVYKDTFSALAQSISDRHIYRSSIPCIAFKWASDSEIFSGARVYDNTVHFFVNSEMEEVDSEKRPEYEYPQMELEVTKPIFLETMELNEKEIVFFAGSAKNNQIVLYAYDGRVPGGRPMDKRYFGAAHQYEAAALIKTWDGGLAILGTTYVASRLARICLFKLSCGQSPGPYLPV